MGLEFHQKGKGEAYCAITWSDGSCLTRISSTIPNRTTITRHTYKLNRDDTRVWNVDPWSGYATGGVSPTSSTCVFTMLGRVKPPRWTREGSHLGGKTMHGVRFRTSSTSDCTLACLSMEHASGLWWGHLNSRSVRRTPRPRIRMPFRWMSSRKRRAVHHSLHL